MPRRGVPSWPSQLTQAHLTTLVCLYLLFVPLCAKKQIPKSACCYFHCQQSHSKGRIFFQGLTGKRIWGGKGSWAPQLHWGSCFGTQHLELALWEGMWGLVTGLRNISPLPPLWVWDGAGGAPAGQLCPRGTFPGNHRVTEQSLASPRLALVSHSWLCLLLLQVSQSPPRGYKPSSLSPSPSLSAS